MRRFAASILFLIGALVDAQNIYTVAGIPYTHRNSVDGQPALNAPLGAVYALLIDKPTGRLLFNDEILVERLEPDGTLLALVGSGPVVFRSPQSPGPSDLASALDIQDLRGMAEDAAGNLYLSDVGAGRVYRVALDGAVSVFAGGGTLDPGFQSDGGPATAARLSSPRGLAFDSKGNLDIAEVYCNCIRQVSPAGIITTLYTLPPAAERNRFRNIEGLTIDARDNVYFTEWYDNLVVKVSPDGSTATTIAGTGVAGFSGDGGPATAAQLYGPSSVTLDSAGNIYIADTLNNRLRLVTPDGNISTIAGTGKCGIAGDGGPAATAQLCLPAETLFDSTGRLLIADYGNHRVRRMTLNGNITTIAGNGKFDPNLNFPQSSGNGGPEIHATFNLIGGTVFDAAGNLYVSETFGCVIRKIAPDGTVSTFAGTGKCATSGDGGPALQAQLQFPGPISIAPDGSLYVITSDSRVRKITPDGIIHAVAGNGPGTGLNRAQGDGGLAVNATLNEPGAVAFDQGGNIFIADTSNARVRKINVFGIISTVAGPAPQLGADYYNSVAVDPQGRVYVAWTHSLATAIYATVNRVNPDGSLTRIAGSGAPCTNGPGQFTGDGLPATQVRLCAVTGLAVDSNGLLYLSEGGYSLVLRINADGTIQRMAGNTAATSIGDGGPALQASLRGGQGFSPGPVTFDSAGNMYFPEPGLNVVREVTNTAYTFKLSPDHIDATGSAIQTQTVQLSPNFAEPFPYAVRVSNANGGAWLSANRVTGITNEAITVTINPTGLARGTYRGTVAVIVSVPVGAATQEVDVPVSVTVP